MDAAFGQFEMGIDGLGPLWGPEPVLVERVRAALAAALPGETVPPRAGVAGTHFAATIAAVHARAGTPVAVPPGDEAAFLAPYPSGLLTTDLDVRARLTRFGLRKIGAVAELPRSALIARFGDEGAGSTPGRVARRPSRSGRATPPSGWPSPCPSSRRSRTSSRCASCSTGSWPRSRPSSPPGDSPRTART